MKNILLIGSVLAVIVLLIALTIPALAHGSDSGNTSSAGNGAWEDMYNACQNGDWEAMEEAARSMHGEDFGQMPYNDEDNNTSDEKDEASGEKRDGMGDHMGGGMGGGMMGGGMMGW